MLITLVHRHAPRETGHVLIIKSDYICDSNLSVAELVAHSSVRHGRLDSQNAVEMGLADVVVAS